MKYLYILKIEERIFQKINREIRGTPLRVTTLDREIKENTLSFVELSLKF